MTVFRKDFPEDSDFPYVAVGGMGTEPSSVAMADSYILAATLLIDSWEGHKEPWMVCYPILYLCRHALELYLKDALPLRSEPSHNLHPLIDDFRSLLQEWLSVDIPMQLRKDLYTLTDRVFAMLLPREASSYLFQGSTGCRSTTCGNSLR